MENSHIRMLGLFHAVAYHPRIDIIWMDNTTEEDGFRLDVADDNTKLGWRGCLYL